MRFLLFNLVVGAAVFYLLAGDAGDTARKAGLSEDAVSAIETLSQKARTAVKATVPETEPVDAERPAKRSPPTKSEIATVETPKVETAKTGPTGTTDPKAPRGAAKPAAETAATTAARPDTEAEARYVETRPIHAAPSARQLAAATPGRPATGEIAPAVAERRAEVLGGRPEGGKFVVKGESRLMSPEDRYHELSKLVDDMELVYFNSLGN